MFCWLSDRIHKNGRDAPNRPKGTVDSIPAIPSLAHPLHLATPEQ